MRAVALVALLVLAIGCRSSDSASHVPFGEPDIQILGEHLSGKLVGLESRFKDRPTLRVVAVKNETGRKLRLDLIEDEVRRRAVESNKFAVSADPDRRPDYVLLTTITDTADELTFTFELLELASKHRLLLETVSFSNC